MRKLKFHEKKLLKKTNFLEWKREGGHRENQIMQRYHVVGRDDYKKFVSNSAEANEHNEANGPSGPIQDSDD